MHRRSPRTSRTTGWSRPPADGSEAIVLSTRSPYPIARVAQVNVDTGPTLGGGRIDLVWGVRMQPRSAQTLPRLGSDHRPVVTVWTPTSAAAA